MTEEIALETFKSPEKIIDPETCNFVTSFLTGWIVDTEETLNEQNYQVSVKFGELYAATSKISLAERQLELEPIYLAREKTKLKVAQLKRYRQDLKDRFNVLTNKRF